MCLFSCSWKRWNHEGEPLIFRACFTTAGNRPIARAGGVGCKETGFLVRFVRASLQHPARSLKANVHGKSAGSPRRQKEPLIIDSYAPFQRCFQLFVESMRHLQTSGSVEHPLNAPEGQAGMATLLFNLSTFSKAIGVNVSLLANNLLCPRARYCTQASWL